MNKSNKTSQKEAKKVGKRPEKRDIKPKKGDKTHNIAKEFSKFMPSWY